MYDKRNETKQKKNGSSELFAHVVGEVEEAAKKQNAFNEPIAADARHVQMACYTSHHVCTTVLCDCLKIRWWP